MPVCVADLEVLSAMKANRGADGLRISRLVPPATEKVKVSFGVCDLRKRGLGGASDGSGPDSGLSFLTEGIPMQTDVLRVLRATAASWWRHKELRRTGQTELAQRLEHGAVLRDLGHLRQAANLPHAHVICGEGGTFLHLGWTTVSTSAPIERFPLAALAVARGTPFIDIRPITDVIAFANLPRVTQDGSVDPEPWGPGSYVSLTTYIDLAEQLGRRITNDPGMNRSS